MLFLTAVKTLPPAGTDLALRALALVPAPLERVTLDPDREEQAVVWLARLTARDPGSVQGIIITFNRGLQEVLDQAWDAKPAISSPTPGLQPVIVVNTAPPVYKPKVSLAMAQTTPKLQPARRQRTSSVRSPGVVRLQAPAQREALERLELTVALATLVR